MSDYPRHELPHEAIPFVLAATGHRDLVAKDVPRLRREVCEMIGRMAQRMSSTPLLLLSGLAEGADQLIADAALERGAYLGVVLPLPKDLYRSLMSKPAQAEFDRLLAAALLVIDLPLQFSADELQCSEEARVRQYCALAKFLAMHCQALIALWDGEKSGRAGGTFEAVCSVLGGVEYENCMEPLRGTVYQIVTPRQQHKAPLADAFNLHVMRCPSDLDEISRAVPREYHTKSWAKVEEEADREVSFVTSAELKRWRLEPRHRFWRWAVKPASNQTGAVARWRGNLWRWLVEPSPTEAHLDELNEKASQLKERDLPKWRLQPASWKQEPWAYLNRTEECFRRADVIAVHSQRRKSIYLSGILLLAFLAAVGLETHAELLSNVHLLWLAFPAFIILAFALHWGAGRRDVENWFLDARALAEALRVQYFWELGGVRKPVWQHYMVQRPSELGWVVSALRGLSLLSHEKPSPLPATAGDVRGALTGWVGDQAGWYKKKSRQQQQSLRCLELGSSAVLVGVVLVSVVCGSITLAHSHRLKPWQAAIHTADPRIHWSIAVISVAVGLLKVWLEQAGYDEQARNYRRMGHLFAQRKKIMERLSRTESGMESTRESESENLKQAIALLRELGTRALEENSIWLIMHRDHPLKVTGGS